MLTAEMLTAERLWKLRLRSAGLTLDRFARFHFSFGTIKTGLSLVYARLTWLRDQKLRGPKFKFGGITTATILRVLDDDMEFQFAWLAGGRLVVNVDDGCR